ncbi:MAG: hypothetical protein ACLFU8_08265 [Anaerolineales bacterium]
MTTLHYVTTADEIRRSLRNFNREAPERPDFVRDLLRHVTYWVYDPQNQTFGPNTFVGFQEMSVTDYLNARAGEGAGVAFDASAARRSIERVLGEAYRTDRELAIALEAWSISLLHEITVFEGVDRAKWKFIALEA